MNFIQKPVFVSFLTFILVNCHPPEFTDIDIGNFKAGIDELKRFGSSYNFEETNFVPSPDNETEIAGQYK